jgi:glutamine synthetase
VSASSFDRIRVLWPDHFGFARGKYVPMRRAEHGARHCITTFALGYDRSMVPAPGAMMLEGMPDMQAVFALDALRPSWEDDRTAVVVADLHYQDEPLAMSPRQALVNAVADWDALGFEPLVGIELEAYILQPDNNGGWEPWHTPGSFVYGTGRSVDPTGLLDEIWSTAERVGLPVESINSEYDTPQFELTLEHSDALRAVDDAFLFRVLAREVALKHGLLCTFLGRPFADRGGSGLHVNFSLRDRTGGNALLDDRDDGALSKLALQCVAGQLAHHEGMAALCAPTVNAYKRLRPGQLSGYWANWGYDHRCATVRVPAERGAGTRLENRMPDGAANPYLAAAAVLQAARLGHVNGLDVPEAETGDGFEEANTDRHTPENLSAALDALEADTELVAAVGPALVDQFVAVKRAEWDTWCRVVTDWEHDYYLHYH